MKKPFTLFILLLCQFSFAQEAQEYKYESLKNGIISGDLNSLKEVKNVNILYDESEMIVGDKLILGDSFVKEEDYTEKKFKAVEEKEGKEKGAEYREKWSKWRSSGNYAEFAKVFNKYGQDINMSGINFGVAYDCTLTVKPVRLYVGYPYQIDAFFIFTDKNGKELVTLFFENQAGAPNYMYHAYGRAAKTLADYILNNRK